MVAVILLAGMLTFMDTAGASPIPAKNHTDSENSTDTHTTSQNDSELPWWSTDEMINNVFPWSNYHHATGDQHYGNEEKYFILRNRDGKDGPMKHIMRVLSFLPPTEQQLELYKTYTPPPNAGRTASEVCPLFVDPLYENGQYRPCSPKNTTACPLPYSCQMSPVLGAHLCCHEIPVQQPFPGAGNYITQSPFDFTRSPWDTWQTPQTHPLPLQPPVGRSSWINPLTPTEGQYGVSERQERRPSWEPRQMLHPKHEGGATTVAAAPVTIIAETSTATETPTTTVSTTTATTNTTTALATTTSLTSTPDVSTSTASTAALPLSVTDTVSTEPLSLTSTVQLPSSSESHPSTQSIEEVTEPIPGSSTIPNSGPVQVVQLTMGSLKTLPNGDIEYVSTMTLIKDGEKRILVDTGLPTDTNTLIRELSKLGMRPDGVDIVITTHGHPDHYGNQNLFSRKRQLFSSYEYIGNKFYKTALAENLSRKLTPNVEVWKTPGHTTEDLSVIVRNVPGYGTIAVTGDLVLNEQYLHQTDHWASTGSWDVNVQKQSLTTIICMSDWIVPGHGITFKVTDQHRKQANCSNRYIFNGGRH